MSDENELKEAKGKHVSRDLLDQTKLCKLRKTSS